MLFDGKELDEEISDLKMDIKDQLFREPRSIFWTDKIKRLIELMAKQETALFLGASDPRDKTAFMCEMKAYKKIILTLGGLEPTAHSGKRG